MSKADGKKELMSRPITRLWVWLSRDAFQCKCAGRWLPRGRKEGCSRRVPSPVRQSSSIAASLAASRRVPAVYTEPGSASALKHSSNAFFFLPTYLNSPHPSPPPLPDFDSPFLPFRLSFSIHHHPFRQASLLTLFSRVQVVLFPRAACFPFRHTH